MPPLSKTKADKKFGINFKLACEFQECLLSSQLEDVGGGSKGGNLRDTRLVCADGWVDVHAIFLAAKSSFLKRCIESQGDCYLSRRNILLLDWNLSEIKVMVQLLYTGSVTLSSEEEINGLRGLLAFFEIEIQDDLSTKKLSGGSQVGNKVGVEIRYHQNKKKTVTTKESGGVTVASTTKLTPSSKTSPNPAITPTTTARGRRVTKRRYNDSDWEPDTDDDDECGKEGSALKVTKVVGETGVGVAAVISSASKPSSMINVATVSGGGRNDEITKPDENGGTDWVEPNYTDKAWFDKEARRCQHCKKGHEGPAQASSCITGHSKLRCYFCFTVCNNTENLFEHFRSHHKQAGRENCLLCPYCDQTIPFKSVSCHVISTHLSDAKTHNKGSKEKPSSSTTGPVIGTSRPPGPGQPPTATIRYIPVVRLSRTMPDMKKINSNQEEKHSYHYDCDGKIRPKKLDLTITRPGLDGKIWVWRFQEGDTTEHVGAVHNPQSTNTNGS